MKRSIPIIKMIPLLLCFFSCKNNYENNKLIIGSWSGTEWLVNGQPSGLNFQSTHFNFNEQGEYSFEYSGNIEKGTYKVENDMLFTKPTGQQEIMVKIIKITQDSMVFDMNRGGQPESLTLLRK